MDFFDRDMEARWEAEDELRREAEYAAHEDGHTSFEPSCWLCVQDADEAEAEAEAEAHEGHALPDAKDATCGLCVLEAEGLRV